MIGIVTGALLEHANAPWRWLGTVLVLLAGIGAFYAMATYFFVSLKADKRTGESRRGHQDDVQKTSSSGFRTSDTSTTLIIISRNQLPSLEMDTGDQPSAWFG